VVSVVGLGNIVLWEDMLGGYGHGDTITIGAVWGCSGIDYES